MGTQSPAPSTRGRGEYNPQAVLTGSGRCLLPAQGMTWFPSTAACMSVAPSCRLLGEQERELSTNPSLPLAACAPWQGASEHPPRFLLCCPGGLGSTELTHRELPAPQGPRNYVGRACQAEAEGWAWSRPVLPDLPNLEKAKPSPSLCCWHSSALSRKPAHGEELGTDRVCLVSCTLGTLRLGQLPSWAHAVHSQRERSTHPAHRAGP